MNQLLWQYRRKSQNKHQYFNEFLNKFEYVIRKDKVEGEGTTTFSPAAISYW